MMMRILRLLLLFISAGHFGCAQIPTKRPHIDNPAFDKKISGMISFSVPTISVEELKAMENAQILDTRQREEYEVSHIPKAKYLGYKEFSTEKLTNVDKSKPIVLYCSIGYRSEKIGEKLQKLGYTEVYNLYGSIFEWVNEGNIVVDKSGNPTQKIHTYNKSWSKWVDENKAEKVW